MNEQLSVIDSNTSILPRDIQAEINDVIAMENAVTQVFEKGLVQKIDFDRIPGTDRPTLLKPGAERLCHLFKLAPGEPKVIEKTEDWDKGIFSYTIGQSVVHRVSGEDANMHGNGSPS